jgi:hypothetical protein
MMLPRLLIAALIVSLGAMSVGTAEAGTPPTYTVTRNDDPAPDGCQPNDCSTREAFLAANSSAGPNTIVIPAMEIELSIEGTDDTGDAGDLDILDDVIIQGAGVAVTTIDANQIDAVIDIPGPPGLVEVDVSIKDLTITGGSNSGIRNQGILDLSGLNVFGNHNAGDGGGITNPYGVITMDNSTVGKNSTDARGGGIGSNSNLTVRTSTIWINNAMQGGGGIYSAGGVSLYRATVDRNQAIGGAGGGVLFTGAPSIFKSSTISSNTSDEPGGGIANDGATGTAIDTIIADNGHGLAPSDCAGTFGGDNNLVQNTTGCTLTGLNNITGQDPMLFALDNYGGPTMTRAIIKTSPAFDKGNEDCYFPDQRGLQGPHSLACDIGAYEYIFLGDVDCGGFATLVDVFAYLQWIAADGEEPFCHYLGDTQCDLLFNETDVLFLLRALTDTGLPPSSRPEWCGDIGPFET